MIGKRKNGAAPPPPLRGVKKKNTHHFDLLFHSFSVQATLKGEEKPKPAARRQTHTQGRFLVILYSSPHFPPLCQVGKKKHHWPWNRCIFNSQNCLLKGTSGFQ